MPVEFVGVAPSSEAALSPTGATILSQTVKMPSVPETKVPTQAGVSAVNGGTNGAY